MEQILTEDMGVMSKQYTWANFTVLRTYIGLS